MEFVGVRTCDVRAQLEVDYGMFELKQRSNVAVQLKFRLWDVRAQLESLAWGIRVQIEISYGMLVLESRSNMGCLS
eukprot:352112-Pyramimonas_sp.AAC.1